MPYSQKGRCIDNALSTRSGSGLGTIAALLSLKLSENFGDCGKNLRDHVVDFIAILNTSVMKNTSAFFHNLRWVVRVIVVDEVA